MNNAWARYFNFRRVRKTLSRRIEEEISAMYAIIETGGKQSRVQKDDVLRVDVLSGEVGDTVVFDKILVRAKDDSVEFGRPYVLGASVKAEILSFGRGDKILVFRYKSKKNIRKMRGHRQNYTEIKITEVV